MKRIIFIVFSCICSLLLLGKFLDYHYKKFWWPVFQKMDVAFKDSAYYDGIYLGDSYVYLGMNPYYIDSTIGLHTYNLGMLGAPVNEVYLLANAYLSNHRAPKFAIISMGYKRLFEDSLYFECPYYYYFYLDNELNNQALRKQQYHTDLFKILPILKYTVLDDFNKQSVLRSLSGETMVTTSCITYQGFINNTTSFPKAQALNREKEYSSFENATLRLQQLVQLLRRNNCTPIFVYPPQLQNSLTEKNSDYKQIDTAILKMSTAYAAPILHFDTDSCFKQSLFGDMDSHLTIKGSIIYSRKLGLAIKQILSSPK